MPKAIHSTFRKDAIDALKPIAKRYYLGAAFIVVIGIIVALILIKNGSSPAAAFGGCGGTAALMLIILRVVFGYKKQRHRHVFEKRALATIKIQRWYRAAKLRRAQELRILVKKYLNVVLTNVDCISQARIIGLGELHGDLEHRLLNGRLIDLIFKRGDRTLIETGDTSMNKEARRGYFKRNKNGPLGYVQKEVQVAHWNKEKTEGAIQKEFELFDDIERLNKHRSNRKELLDLIEKYKEFIPKEDQAVLQALVEKMTYDQVQIERLSEEAIDLPHHPYFRAFLAGFRHHVYVNLSTVIMREIEEEWCSRQESLCQEIQTEIELNTDHILPIYGMDHGRKKEESSKKYKRGVDIFHTYLRNSGLPFMLLEPKKGVKIPDRWKDLLPFAGKQANDVQVSSEVADKLIAQLQAGKKDLGDYIWYKVLWKEEQAQTSVI